MDLIRDYPGPACWWIGLLLLHLRRRSQGLGEDVYRRSARWMSVHGRVRLGVIEQNEAAVRFWTRLGCGEIGSAFGQRMGARVNTVIVMEHDLEVIPGDVGD